MEFIFNGVVFILMFGMFASVLWLFATALISYFSDKEGY